MNKLIYAFFVSLVLSVAVTAYSDGIQEDLQDNLIRLHIIANSDGGADQAVKLKVRDAVLSKMHEETQNKSRGEIIKNLDEIEKTANRVLDENCLDYTASAVYGKFYFPKKEYRGMTLPSGEYYGVRIVLGNGNGHNWWCVMYPPLCVSEEGSAGLDEEAKELLKNSLNTETYDIVTQSDKKVVVKFKAVELVQELREKLKN